MSEIDKMARELLAQWHLDRGLGEKVARDCRSGVIDIPEIYWDLIRTALLAAPPGWKLVPVQPTDEMIDSAEDAYMPYGDMRFAITSAIVAAPEPK